MLPLHPLEPLDPPESQLDPELDESPPHESPLLELLLPLQVSPLSADELPPSHELPLSLDPEESPLHVSPPLSPEESPLHVSPLEDDELFVVSS